MTKQDLVAYVASRAGVSKRIADACLKATVEGIAGALERGERVAIPGFGVFVVKERAPRTVRNPQTKEIMTVPARKAVVFRPSSVLKRRVK